MSTAVGVHVCELFSIDRVTLLNNEDTPVVEGRKMCVCVYVFSDVASAALTG